MHVSFVEQVCSICTNAFHAHSADLCTCNMFDMLNDKNFANPYILQAARSVTCTRIQLNDLQSIRAVKLYAVGHTLHKGIEPAKKTKKLQSMTSKTCNIHVGL